MRPQPCFRLTLLALLAAGGAVWAQERATPADARAGSVTPAAADENTVDRGLAGILDMNWGGLPPISYHGTLAYDLRTTRAHGEGNSVDHLFTGTIGARTYLYQPWFATLSGSVRLTTAASRASGTPDPLAPQLPQQSSEQFITGNAQLNVFPRSRFPFELHFERTDSRIDSGLASPVDYRTTNFGLSQRYRPAAGNWSLSANYDHREQAGLGFRDVQDSLAGEFGTHWKDQELNLGGSLSHARRQLNGDTSDFRSLVARHRYAPVGPLSVDTTVNVTQTQENVAASPSDLTVLQWSSVGLYHREGSPLALTASARAVLLRDAVGDHGIDSVAVSGGATYDINSNLRFTGSGTLTSTRSNEADTLGFSGSGGVSWQADTLQVMDLRYDRFATGTVSVASSHSSRIESETQQTLQGQAGHSVSRSWSLASNSALQLTGSQSFTVAASHSNLVQPAAAQNTQRLALHMAALTWTASGDNKSLYARGSLSDSRELGGTHARFQLWNFQLSGSVEFDRYRSLSADFTLQHVQQRAGDQDPGTGVAVRGESSGATSSSGEITYRHNRLFGIAGLRFSSRFKLAQDVLRQPGMLPSLPDRETRLWENRLDWSVGRLEAGVLYRLSQIEGRRRDFLMLRVQRSFGD